MALEDGTRESVKAGRREWIGLAVLTLACVLYAMDLTVLHLAVPSLSADLEPTSAQLLWIVDIYGFMVAGCLITMGTLGDRIGRRRLLMIGAAAFGLVSVLAAFSNSAELLIVCRALQGIAGATLAPSTLSLIFSMFRDPHERSVAIGVWIAGFSAGGAVGPVLGGVLLEQFWWGSVFLLAVPVMAVLLVLGPRLLPEFRDPNAGTLDVASAALSLFSILALIFGLKEIAQDGLGWLPVSMMVAGLAVGIVFARRQRFLTDPMIDLRLFQIRAFNASLATNVLGIFIMVGYFLFVAQYLQLVLGLSPLEAGLWSLPDAAALIVGSTFAPRLLHRIRPAIVIGAGLLLGAVGLVMLARVGPSDLALVVAASVVIALGLAPVFTATTDLIVGSAPPERAGAASGISETGSELGGALGIAILGSVGTAIYRAELAGELPSELPPETVAAARDTLGAAVATTDQLPAGLGDVVIATARNAFIHGMRVTAGIAVVVAIAVAAVAVMYLRHVPSGDGRERAGTSDGAESDRDATVQPVSDVMTP